MGRHTADRPGRPLHADLFVPAPDSAAAFDRLVAPHQEALSDYVLRLTDGDRAAAESVLKETLYRAAQDPAWYPQRTSAVRPWLVLTARTVLRDGERFAPAGHDDRPGQPMPPMPSRTGTTIVRALDDLDAAPRDLLVDLFYRGVSLEGAAAERGIPVETVKSRLYFAMQSLRTVLDASGPPPAQRR